MRIRDPDLTLHYLSAGEGEPVLLLHGWPTSSYLYRHVMVPIARTRRAIALDLPGFGASDKPPDGAYDFRFHERAIDGFLDALGIERAGLVVHDLGGPVGLYWAVHHRERVERLALLNTLVYPRPSAAVVAFVASTYVPGLRSWLVSPAGLAFAMRLGVERKDRVAGAVTERYQSPFADPSARRVLRLTAQRLTPAGMIAIARGLPSLDVPVRLVYGTADRILPDVDRTMRRVQRELPQVERFALQGCGHFLQEDDPERVGELLAEHFG